jgi:hypothetical protein
MLWKVFHQLMADYSLTQDWTSCRRSPVAITRAGTSLFKPTPVSGTKQDGFEQIVRFTLADGFAQTKELMDRVAEAGIAYSPGNVSLTGSVRQETMKAGLAKHKGIRDDISDRICLGTTILRKELGNGTDFGDRSRKVQERGLHPGDKIRGIWLLDRSYPTYDDL